MIKVLKIFLLFLLALFNAILLLFGIYLIQNAYYDIGIILLAALILIDFFILNPKAYPYRYTILALIFLFLLVFYPIYFTLKTALKMPNPQMIF